MRADIAFEQRAITLSAQKAKPQAMIVEAYRVP
jgi:hypothetical protein